MGPSQASHALGVSGQHVRDLCKAGRLVAVRTTLGWLIDPDDVERLRLERADRDDGPECVDAR